MLRNVGCKIYAGCRYMVDDNKIMGVYVIVVIALAVALAWTVSPWWLVMLGAVWLPALVVMLTNKYNGNRPVCVVDDRGNRIMDPRALVGPVDPVAPGMEWAGPPIDPPPLRYNSELADALNASRSNPPDYVEAYLYPPEGEPGPEIERMPVNLPPAFNDVVPQHLRNSPILPPVPNRGEPLQLPVRSVLPPLSYQRDPRLSDTG